METATEEIRQKKAKYKEQLQKCRLPQVSEFLLLKKEQPTREGEEWHKPSSKVEVRFQVIDVSPDASHVSIDRGDYQETIYRDRVELVPRPDFGSDCP